MILSHPSEILLIFTLYVESALIDLLAFLRRYFSLFGIGYGGSFFICGSFNQVTFLAA